ncbi:MAG: amidohydrolase family protein [Phycisphaerae bacterium]|nr:amidohydrolase family protein [Phycisphaerae bacterium]
MPGIDIHTHAFPDNVADRAVRKLSGMGDWRAIGDGTVDGLIASMDAADLDMAVVCPVATKAGQWKGILKWAKKVRKRHGERLLPLGSLHPEDAAPARAVAKMAEAELPGLKLHPFYQGFRIDDDRVRPLLDAAIEHDLLVVLHCGHDIGFENDPIPDRAGPARIAAVLREQPDLRLLCTHMGGWKMWDDVERTLVGMDVTLETSFCLNHMPPDQMLRMIRRHGVERVCFGTDWPWNDQQAEESALAQIGLDDSELRKLMTSSAARLLKLYE